MDVTIIGLPEGTTMQDLATRLYEQYGHVVEAEQSESEANEPERRLYSGAIRGEDVQREKPWNTQLTEIIWHIQEYCNGQAESKARILLDQIQKGDWTLGSETKTDHVDGGFVRMCCGAPDKSSEGDDTDDRATLLEILKIVKRLNGSDARKDVRAIQSMKSVDILITAWGEQPDEDTIEERMCAFCGRDDPCVICGGDWFCDGKCADNHTSDARGFNTDCAYPCKVVDVAANLQEELDEYKETTRVERIDRVAEKEVLNRKYHEDLQKAYAIIEDLESKIMMIPDNFWSVVRQRDAIIKERDKTIDIMENRHSNRKAHIHNLENTIKQQDKTIEDIRSKNFQEVKERHEIYDKELSEQRAIINRITFLRVNEVETRQGIEAELSARKEDSATIQKVVELVRNWNCAPAATYRTMHEIVELFVHYTEPKEISQRPRSD